MNSITAYIDDNKASVIHDKRAIELDGLKGKLVLLSDRTGKVYTPATVALTKLIDDRPVFDITLLEDRKTMYNDTEFNTFDIQYMVGKLNSFYKYATES